MRLRMIIGLCIVLCAVGAVAQTDLNGAGATFPNPIYSKWFSEYHKMHSGIQINYQPIGSGGGIQQIPVGTADFGASDGPITAQHFTATTFKLVHTPTVLDAVIPPFKLPS